MKKTLLTILLLFIYLVSPSVYAQKPLPKPIKHNNSSVNSSISQRKLRPSKTRTSRIYTVSSSISGNYHGHKYVDLGFPSGIKWAAYNIGASSPEDYGKYYAWGETSTKSEYSVKNSTTYNKDRGDISGNSTYDVARSLWGWNWRLPTRDDIEELFANCDYEWTSYKGVKGAKFKSKKNGRIIFIPAAGHYLGTSLNDAGDYGYYWISAPYKDKNNAYSLYFCKRKKGWGYWFGRFLGHSVRPVSF